MLAFKAHLKKLKTQLFKFKFNQKHKIIIFLTKLKQNLKLKILNINNVLRLQKNILTLIIMQKKIMKRNQRDKNAIDFNYQNENHKNFKSNFKFKKKTNRIINSNFITTTRQRAMMINSIIFVTIQNRLRS